MSIRTLLFALVLAPAVAMAQQAAPPARHSTATELNTETPNATTLAVLLANRPAQFSETELLLMMERPVNRSVYPLRVTREMLDTLVARALDPRSCTSWCHKVAPYPHFVPPQLLHFKQPSS